MFWIDMNKSCVFDGFFCCWFSQVIVSAPEAADRRLTDRQCRHACHCWQPKVRSLWKARRENEWALEWKPKSMLSACQNAKGRMHERKRDTEREARPPQSLCSRLWWRPTQALVSGANGFLMPANSRGIYWDEGWKNRRGGERMRVTTMFGRGGPGWPLLQQPLPSLQTQAQSVFMQLVIADLKLWSFPCLQPHLSWSCLHIFLEVWLFFLRLTQMKSHLCGNHMRNCLYCSAIYRWMSSWLVITHSLKLDYYAVKKRCPIQV